MGLKTMIPLLQCWRLGHASQSGGLVVNMGGKQAMPVLFFVGTCCPKCGIKFKTEAKQSIDFLSRFYYHHGLAV